MKRSIFIAATSMICISQSALADNSGAYLGAGLASATIYSTCADYVFGSCKNASNSPKDSGHLRLIGGYNFDKHFGVEAGFSDLGTYRVRDTAGTTVGDFGASAITLALKGGNTFANGFSIFGKLGLANVVTKYNAKPGWILVDSPTQRSTGVVAGVIGQYNINDNFGLRLSIEMINYTDAEFNVLARGVALMGVYNF